MFQVETRPLPYSECVSIASAFEPFHHHNEATSKNTDVIFFDKKAISFWTHKKNLITLYIRKEYLFITLAKSSTKQLMIIKNILFLNKIRGHAFNKENITGETLENTNVQ